MGKYIIEVGDAYAEYVCGKGDMLCLPVRINEFEDNWLNTDIPLTPYTEPDMEKIREEAYEDGYKTAKVQCNIQAEKDLREVGERHYQKGLSDAWTAARKICLPEPDGGISTDDICKIFNVSYYTLALKVCSASEAIEKIRQYEQEKKEQIAKGDVVRMKSAPEIEILVTCADGDYISGIALTEMDDNCEIGDQYTNVRICKVKKTGRHYEIAEVLRKMKEAK